jgi:hypothetical protein
MLLMLLMLSMLLTLSMLSMLYTKNVSILIPNHNYSQAL